MDFLTLLATASALGMDCLAVSAAVAAALPRIGARQVFRLAWHFGLFQGGMAAMGWLGGAALSRFMQAVDHWIAFGILVFLGLRMIMDSLRAPKEGRVHDPTRGWSLLVLSVATSIDALAVGVTLGLFGSSILFPSAVIAVMASFMSIAGALAGTR